jgi:phenylalanyl-tRNA synthetase beta chain
MQTVPSNGWSVQIPKSGSCLAYGALVINNVEALKAPFLLRLALQHMGIRSQGLLVDCANYVMLCTGQPMHAFDANSFLAKQIVVRESAGDETLNLIDKKTYTILPGVLTITNGKEPVAIAGVMGGSASAVSDGTTKIVLESAIFDAKVVRRSGKCLGLFSEAMRRYERGIDPNGWKRALFLFWQLLSNELPKATLEAYISEGGQIVSTKSVTCRVSRVESILGKKFSSHDIENVFSRLQYPCEWQDLDTLCVQVPAFRHDVTEEIDLIEDIAKLTNFAELILDNGPKVSLTKMSDHPRYVYETSIRRLLVSLGVHEFVTCDLISPTMADLVAGQPVPRHAMISVLNPISVEQSILRPSLFPSLLECVRRNIDHGTSSISAFEIGTAHLRNEAQLHERLVLGVILSGGGKGEHFSENLRDVDFFDMKGILETIRDYFAINGLTMSPSSISLFHEKRQAVLFCGNQQVGMLGEVHPTVLRKTGIGQRVYFMELDMQDLLKSSQKAGAVIPLAMYPSIERDWTLTVPESLSYQELYDTVRQYAGTFVESITLKSIFRHERIGNDKKNVTLRIVFRDQEKTLTSNEVDEGYAKLVEGASLALGVGVCQL